MKKITVQVTYECDLIVKDDAVEAYEFKDEGEMLDHCASYRFSKVSPVIRSGDVEVDDVLLLDLSIVRSEVIEAPK